MRTTNKRGSANLGTGRRAEAILWVVLFPFLLMLLAATSTGNLSTGDYRTLQK